MTAARRLRRTLAAAWIPALITTALIYDYLRDHPATAWTLLTLLVATLLLWRTRRRIRARIRAAIPARQPREIRGTLRLTPTQFEHHIADLLRADGHTHVTVSGGAGDLGADITSRDRQGRRVVVQCKRYNPRNPVGSEDMQRFMGTARPHHHADVAMFVTTSRFTAPAAALARQHDIWTIDGPALAQWQARRFVPWA